MRNHSLCYQKELLVHHMPRVRRQKNHVQLKKGNDRSLQVQEQKVTNHRSPIQSRYLRIGAKGHNISDTLIMSITFTIKQINISLSSFWLSLFF